MKSFLGIAFLSILSSFITTCNAQASHIGFPTPGTQIHAGQNVTVQIVRPNSIQGSTEVGLAIGLVSCQSASSCPTPDAQMGRVLYTGPFTPVIHEIPGTPYQNFSLRVPSVNEGMSTGPAQVQVARLHLIGAGPSPILELNDVGVTVV